MCAGHSNNTALLQSYHEMISAVSGKAIVDSRLNNRSCFGPQI
jgi:hypothetical protein